MLYAFLVLLCWSISLIDEVYLFIYLTLPIIYIYIQELHTMDKWQGTRYSLRQLQRPFNGYTFKNINNSTEHYTTNYETKVTHGLHLDDRRFDWHLFHAPAKISRHALVMSADLQYFLLLHGSNCVIFDVVLRLI